MQIGELLQNKKIEVKEVKGAPRNARQAVLQEVIDAVNPERVSKGLKPLTIPFMEARYTKGMSYANLSQKLALAKKANNLGRYFFWVIKKEQNKP